MIPKCITLTNDQKLLLNRWVSEIDIIDPPSEYEEDASMASGVTFSIYSTGIGDSIRVGLRGHWLTLGYGDDGELLTPLDFIMDSDGEFIGEADD